MTQSDQKEPGRADSENSRVERENASVDQRDPSEPNFFWRLCRMIARPVMTLMFQLKVYGRHHVPRRGGSLIVSNHQSYLDPVLIGVFLPRPMAYLSKSELFKNKYFAWLILSLHAFPIRQGKGDVGAMKELIKRLKQGYLANVFVEGTRTVNGELLPIEPGAALVVRRAGVPVVPCVIDGSFQAWPRTEKIFHAYPISVMYGPPLKVEGLKANEITQLIERTLHEMFDELRRDPQEERMNKPTLEDLTKLVLDFREERDWKQFHNAKDMALSLSLEAAELLELMQWRNGAELEAHLRASKERVGQELADVLGWILLLANDQQIDLADAFAKKIELNKRKYPVEKAKGSAKKYDEL